MPLPPSSPPRNPLSIQWHPVSHQEGDSGHHHSTPYARSPFSNTLLAWDAGMGRPICSLGPGVPEAPKIVSQIPLSPGLWLPPMALPPDSHLPGSILTSGLNAGRGSRLPEICCQQLRALLLCLHPHYASSYTPAPWELTPWGTGPLTLPGQNSSASGSLQTGKQEGREKPLP